ncbi:cytochrome P450 [Mycena vulgaris]|nr:cytochrome P450 [Mycena vulgaris]
MRHKNCATDGAVPVETARRPVDRRRRQRMRLLTRQNKHSDTGNIKTTPMAYFLSFLCGSAAIAGYWLIKYLREVRLQGPPSHSFLFGHTKEIMGSQSPADLYDGWAQTYRSVYRVRGPLGTDRIVVCDPKAIAHVYALDSWKYCHTPLARRQLSSLTGPMSLLIAVGESHSRQRKILNPVFGPAALKTINNVSFDFIGLTAFAHNFKSLEGEKSDVLTALTAVGHSKPSPNVSKILLPSQAYPILLKLPLPRSALVADLSNAMDAVVDGLTDAVNSGRTGEGNPESALGVLRDQRKGTISQADSRTCEIHTIGGFTTTASSIKARYPENIWALVELSMKPETQDRLRAEFSSFSTRDPTYDELTSLALPYLDAVVCETLRLHPVLSESTRVALEDDVLPLAKPIRAASGAIDKLPVQKGAVHTTSLVFTNLAKSIWGADAAEFKPERRLNDAGGVPATAKEYPGYHHIMTFLDGPRTCLGKGFALAEMKIVLSLLIRKFVFSPRDGKETKYDKAMFLGPHPKVAGEPGGQLPMRVKRVE